MLLSFHFFFYLQMLFNDSRFLLCQLVLVILFLRNYVLFNSLIWLAQYPLSSEAVSAEKGFIRGVNHSCTYWINSKWTQNLRGNLFRPAKAELGGNKLEHTQTHVLCHIASLFATCCIFSCSTITERHYLVQYFWQLVKEIQDNKAIYYCWTGNSKVSKLPIKLRRAADSVDYSLALDDFHIVFTFSCISISTYYLGLEITTAIHLYYVLNTEYS